MSGGGQKHASVIGKAMRLKTPCNNCPFLKKGAIELRPGRLDGIVDDLLRDDMSTFQCHKTVHHKNGGEWDEEGVYRPSGNEAMCAGAAAFLMKRGRPTVGMRLGLVTGAVEVSAWDKAKALVID